jgi:hypothetical protein
MKIHKLYIAAIICFFTTNLLAQTESLPPAKKDKFAVYAGIGPNIYFNNLVLAKDYVNPVQYSFAGRIMWEPEHLLSLGLESGYYRLYSVSFPEQPEVKISNSAIPIQVVVSMKFLKTFYFNFSSGQTILINKVHTPKYGDIDASTLSLGDYAGTLGYKYKLKKHLSILAEVKFFHASKLDDKNMALLFLAGYSF